MNALTTSQDLKLILNQHLGETTLDWMENNLQEILVSKSAQKLYMTYSLLGSKIAPTAIAAYKNVHKELEDYLSTHSTDLLQIGRIYLLSAVLEGNAELFEDKVAKIIEVADTGELEVFLKYLMLLPNAERFKNVAVEALRTNISVIFDAIALNNPYPSTYFNKQQWNQMYLKAAFMQRDLTQIINVDERSNKDLARIISDYAHERWAASREIDPVFWRPVSNFIEGVFLEDMKRLFNSKNRKEQMAATLCCFYSNKIEAKELLKNYPDLLGQVVKTAYSWKEINE